MSAVTTDPLMSSPPVPQSITPVTTDPPMSSLLVPQSITPVTTDPPMSSPLVPQSITPVTTDLPMSSPLVPQSISPVTTDPPMSSPLVPQSISPVTTDLPMSSPLVPQSISPVTTDPPMSSPLVPQSISPVTTNPPMSSPLAVISEKSSSLIFKPTLKPSPFTALTGIPCKCHTCCNSRKNCPCKKSGVPCSVECHPGHECTNCVPLPEQTSVDLMLKETPSSPKKDTPSELLSKEQRSILSTNAWLDDTIIDMGQSLLKAKYGTLMDAVSHTWRKICHGVSTQ